MQNKGLYDARFEHDNCGIGAVVNIKGNKTNKTVDDALTIVEQLEHRAGKDVTGTIGDGVGILTQIPYDLFQKEIPYLPQRGDYGVGMFFCPQDSELRQQVQDKFEAIVKQEGLEFITWRKVPCQEDILGQYAKESMPYILQAFIKKPELIKAGIDFDRVLYQVRRLFEHCQFKNTYVCSLSSRTITYKGMLLVNQLRTFYLDLYNKDYKSAIALVHSRFSTNTTPSWERAHPNRMIVHNGEINTIKGNIKNMFSREETMKTSFIDTKKVYPVVDDRGSDSSMLDNTIEFMMMAGYDLPRAVMTCIPEPYENNRFLSTKKKEFFEYNAAMMEPWDGPASIMFSDGDIMGAILDRNGLRPTRYYLTDDYLVLSSEVGALQVNEEDILEKGRLHPGKMIVVDTTKGKVYRDEEIKEYYASMQPYGEWLEKRLVYLKDIHIPNLSIAHYQENQLLQVQKAHGYSYEDTKYIQQMAINGNEGIIAMGADKSLAVLADNHPPLFDYFMQLFAQVTNPPIDSLREEIVTSSSVFLGKDGNLLNDSEENCHLLKIRNPILSNSDMLKIKQFNKSGFKVGVVDIVYQDSSLEEALNQVFKAVDDCINDGCNIVVLSDKKMDAQHLAIPSLLAVSAVNAHLVNIKKRNSLALIIECGDVREVHHYATLLGYGASAINGYLAQETIYHLVQKGLLEKDYYAAVDDYNNGIIHGVIKIASKMGISTIQSYRGSQNFEALGISKEVIDAYFPNTVSRIGGVTLKDIEQDVLYHHQLAFDPHNTAYDLQLDSSGEHKVRSNKQDHLYNPSTIHTLQLATRNNDYQLFKEYTKMIDNEAQINLRSQFEFKKRNSISIDEVEPVENIVKRFKTGAMSYGSISKEAHETLALAMNHLHGKSNSGEGGENPERFKYTDDKNNKCSAIKQVASGRFGVTSEYLCSAKEIQIKMAQGAKPGEGGHLPGSKVYPWIAKTRYSTPGVSLISPPPHHDIYSIEDLAQLIYDLKNANSDARISVKLVSECGIGTIASGVVKAGAEVVLVSGFDGGTGAAPKSSVYHAGLPWELGLAEVQQTLKRNGLRNRVIIETDGKIMTGRDLAIAVLLGAQEYGFATAPLVTLGCVMMRVCNLDTCPVGIATQNPILRKRFNGKAEYVERFMLFIAQELREYMAMLGFRTIDEMVGRSDVLKMKDESRLDLSAILDFDDIDNTRYGLYDFKLESVKDTTVLLKELELQDEVNVQVNNLDRSFGTLFGSTLTKKYGTKLNDDTYTVNCFGSAGQSFGAFIPKGLTLRLFGESNDYIGKGLSGGKIIVKPSDDSKLEASKNVLIGNVALYGATSGEMYINGIAGERFAVRNSGAIAVVEGVGEHGLEYMTGGMVVVLGKVGMNFAAGMSGGIAYVYDKDNTLYQYINKDMVEFENVVDIKDKSHIKQLIENHYHYTNSLKCKEIIENFENEVLHFKKVIPYDYKKMMTLIDNYLKNGFSRQEAYNKAFETFNKGGEVHG